MLDGEWPLRRRHLERWLEGEGLSLSALNSDRRDG
jgi:hypothetical protein